MKNCEKAAKKEKLNIGEKTKKAIRQKPCLPILASIAGADEWTKEIIEARTENIGNLVWQELSPWLDLDNY